MTVLFDNNSMRLLFQSKEVENTGQMCHLGNHSKESTELNNIPKKQIQNDLHLLHYQIARPRESDDGNDLPIQFNRTKQKDRNRIIDELVSKESKKESKDIFIEKIRNEGKRLLIREIIHREFDYLKENKERNIDYLNVRIEKKEITSISHSKEYQTCSNQIIEPTSSYLNEYVNKQTTTIDIQSVSKTISTFVHWKQ